MLSIGENIRSNPALKRDYAKAALLFRPLAPRSASQEHLPLQPRGQYI